MPTTYGCTTHKSCAETFTNIEDWKKHIKTSHPNSLVYWFCEERLSHEPGKIEPCKKGFYSQKDYHAHYDSTHSRTRLSIAQNHSTPLGPMLGLRFHCGFCQNIYVVRGSLAGSGGYAGPGEWYRDYFEHVRGHFEGRNALGKVWTIDEWKWFPVFENGNVENIDPHLLNL
jgi:hypothetical protein